MKQIEQERDTLSQGLQMVERARDWYGRQLAAVADRMKYLGLGRAHQHSVSGWGEGELIGREVSEIAHSLVGRGMKGKLDRDCEWVAGKFSVIVFVFVWCSNLRSYRFVLYMPPVAYYMF